MAEMRLSEVLYQFLQKMIHCWNTCYVCACINILSPIGVCVNLTIFLCVNYLTIVKLYIIYNIRMYIPFCMKWTGCKAGCDRGFWRGKEFSGVFVSVFLIFSDQTDVCADFDSTRNVSVNWHENLKTGMYEGSLWYEHFGT